MSKKQALALSLSLSLSLALNKGQHITCSKCLNLCSSAFICEL